MWEVHYLINKWIAFPYIKIMFFSLIHLNIEDKNKMLDIPECVDTKSRHKAVNVPNTIYLGFGTKQIELQYG